MNEEQRRKRKNFLNRKYYRQRKERELKAKVRQALEFLPTVVKYIEDVKLEGSHANDLPPDLPIDLTSKTGGCEICHKPIYTVTSVLAKVKLGFGSTYKEEEADQLNPKTGQFETVVVMRKVTFPVVRKARICPQCVTHPNVQEIIPEWDKNTLRISERPEHTTMGFGHSVDTSDATDCTWAGRGGRPVWKEFHK